MVVSDVGKAAIIAMIVLGLFALVLFGKASMEEIDQYLLLVIGYLVGNGVNVVRRRAPSNVLVPNVHNDEVLTVAGSYPASITEQGSSDGEAQPR